MKTILLNPGPVTLSNRVRQALLRPDLCHREAEFAELQDTVRTNLVDVYQLSNGDWAAVLLTGSGTAAVEAMLTSVVPNDGHLLIIENGVYGERMTKMAGVHRIPHTSLHHEWGQAIDLVALEKMLGQNSFSHVALVHHETTTGRLNDLESVAGLCKQANVPLLVDGVSSFGAESLKFDEWNIAACAATANKCLHGVPGISFVIARRDQLESANRQPRTVYLDLVHYLQQQDAGSTPFTQSVQCLYALDEALHELNDEGGQPARQKRYWRHMKIIREGMIRNGITALLDESECSCVLQAYNLPKNITYSELHDHLKACGFIIYAGQGDFAKNIFRVSAMGDITDEDMEKFVESVEKITGK